MATVLNDMKITPLSDALGAEVTGINAADLDEDTFARLRDAYHENIVLVVRDQHLTPAEQTAFARRFGEIQYHINKEYLMPGQPEVLILSTEIKDGKNVGVPDAGSDWHSDHSYVDQPTGYTILQSVSVPKTGGDTEWTNMVTAYETLSDQMKARLDGLIGIHSFNRNKNHRMTRPTRHADEKAYFDERSPPDAFHPIARTHPHTRRKALYISPRFTIGIKDMPDAEAQPLLDELFDHIADRDLIYHHKWREGDLVMWDNRSTIHLACHGVKPPEIRRMHRTTILGEIPF
ncbi:MAG: TauD/TfdA family dioxygenase [Rhodospirillaceae bacterium]|jgi:taurine dioxygenase|nr:TauD/TfdA family dioxygenase [Rhodospirillaceae bacterium]MBT5456741.1 TauD/TfdA family dioxygenase [Rhodospirillaceae bacterium]